MTTMAVILDFQSELFLINKLPGYFLSSFESVGLSRRSILKNIFKMAAMVAVLDF